MLRSQIHIDSYTQIKILHPIIKDVNFKYFDIFPINDFGKVKRLFLFPPAILFMCFNKYLPVMCNIKNLVA